MWELEKRDGPDVPIVDDSVDLCELITELLSLSGYVTASAGDGAQALGLLRDGLRPRMILLDRGVPVLDGLRASSMTPKGCSRASPSSG